MAVPLDSILEQRILDLERRMVDGGARLRWIPVSNLHFTLHFLGETTTAQLALIRLAAREAAQEVTPFEIALQGIGAFPSAERPQIVWIGVADGASQLEDLSRRLTAGLARLRLGEDDRPFVAHLTLARVRDRRVWGDLVRALRTFRDADVGRQKIDRIIVMESHLHPRGAHYEWVEEVPLG